MSTDQDVTSFSSTAAPIVNALLGLRVHRQQAQALAEEIRVEADADAPLLPRWWEFNEWDTRPWTCPRCGATTPGTPEASSPCSVCGYRGGE